MQSKISESSLFKHGGNQHEAVIVNAYNSEL